MSNDNMRRLQHSDDEAFERSIFPHMPLLRSSFGHICKTLKESTGGPFVRPDTAGNIDDGSNFASRESDGVTE